jgi:hypothetical protein
MGYFIKTIFVSNLHDFYIKILAIFQDYGIINLGGL